MGIKKPPYGACFLGDKSQSLVNETALDSTSDSVYAVQTEQESHKGQ